jgi:hypothetical protein
MRHELAEAVSELWQTIGRALEGYRPEMHYMRGLGPCIICVGLAHALYAWAWPEVACQALSRI